MTDIKRTLSIEKIIKFKRFSVVENELSNHAYKLYNIEINKIAKKQKIKKYVVEIKEILKMTVSHSSQKCIYRIQGYIRER